MKCKVILELRKKCSLEYRTEIDPEKDFQKMIDDVGKEFKKRFEEKYPGKEFLFKNLLNKRKKPLTQLEREIYVRGDILKRITPPPSSSVTIQPKQKNRKILLRGRRKYSHDNPPFSTENTFAEREEGRKKVFEKIEKNILKKNPGFVFADKLLKIGLFEQCFTLFMELHDQYKRMTKFVLSRRISTILLHLRKFQECYEFMKNYIHIEDTQFHLTFAEVCIKLEKYDEALKTFQELHRQTQQDMYLLSYCLLSSKKLPGLQEENNKTIEMICLKHQTEVRFVFEYIDLQLRTNGDLHKSGEFVVLVMLQMFNETLPDVPLGGCVVKDHVILKKFFEHPDAVKILKKVVEERERMTAQQSNQKPKISQNELKIARSEMFFKISKVVFAMGDIKLALKYCDISFLEDMNNLDVFSYKLYLLRTMQNFTKYIKSVANLLKRCKSKFSFINLGKIMKILKPKEDKHHEEIFQSQKEIISVTNPLDRTKLIICVKRRNISTTKFKQLFYSRKGFLVESEIVMLKVLYGLVVTLFLSNELNKIPRIMELLQKFEIGHQISKVQSLNDVRTLYQIVVSLMFYYFHHPKTIPTIINDPKNDDYEKLYMIGDRNLFLYANRVVGNYRIVPLFFDSFRNFDFSEISNKRKFIEILFENALIPKYSNILFCFGNYEMWQLNDRNNIQLFMFSTTSGMGSQFRHDDIYRYFQVVTEEFLLRCRKYKNDYSIKTFIVCPLVPFASDLVVNVRNYNLTLSRMSNNMKYVGVLNLVPKIQTFFLENDERSHSHGKLEIRNGCMIGDSVVTPCEEFIGLFEKEILAILQRTKKNE